MFDADWQSVRSMLAEVFGETGGVALARGSTTVSGVTATVVDDAAESRDRFGLVTTVQGTAFVIAAADYDFGSGAVEPQVGDRITRTIGGVEHVYEVLAPSGKPPFEPADPDRADWLIHTKHVSP